jgi:peptidoglycan/xylan/chitin deacetylase (PgdA/CDA1 family)
MPPDGSTLKPLVRDLAGAALLATGLTRPSRAARDRLTIVTFHRVLPASLLREYPLPEIAVSVDEFRWFAEYFASHYTCGTLAEVHRRWLSGERPVRPLLAVTFDDGQRDGFEHARPVLAAVGIPASFFVPVHGVERDELLWHDRMGYAAAWLLRASRAQASALLGVTGSDPHAMLLEAMERAKRLSPDDRLALVARVEAAAASSVRPSWDGLMGWEQLRTLSREGHEIGSHSVSHPILPLVDDAQLELEVRGSKERIEAEVGAPCETFCYPNGDCDARVVEAVRRAGYLRAVTTRWGPVAAGADDFQLTRCDIEARRARDRGGRLSLPRLALRLSRYFPGPTP